MASLQFSAIPLRKTKHGRDEMIDGCCKRLKMHRIEVSSRLMASSAKEPSKEKASIAATGCDFRASSIASYEWRSLSRADMLKKRFAHTILKAQKQTLFVCDGDKIERLKLEREEASIQSIQREREASRIALKKMEESVEIEDNISILKELADMIGDFSFAGPFGGSGSKYVNRKLWRPLERFGLYLKKDDC